jgi:response regulator of citrate/malate metabolism
MMLAHYHGQVLNQAELARALGSSEPTARRYLDILCGTLDEAVTAITLPALITELQGSQRLHH